MKACNCIFPENLKRLTEAKILQDILHEIDHLSGGDLPEGYIYFYSQDMEPYFFRVTNNVLYYAGDMQTDGLLSVDNIDAEDENEFSSFLFWFDSAGQVWQSRLIVTAPDYVAKAEDLLNVESVKARVECWQRTDQFIVAHRDFLVLNNHEELKMMLLSKDPAGYEFMMSKPYHGLFSGNDLFASPSLLIAPQIRLLNEWGFDAIVEDDGANLLSVEDYEAIERFTRPGSTPDEVFTVPKEVYEEFKEWSLGDWHDIYERYKEKGEK